MARTRFVGIPCLLVPKDLWEPGNASTPNLTFCQMAFLLTEKFLRSSLLGTFGFCIHKWGKEDISESKSLADCEGRSSGLEEASGKASPLPTKYVRKSWVVSSDKAGRGQASCVFPENGPVGGSALYHQTAHGQRTNRTVPFLVLWNWVITEGLSFPRRPGLWKQPHG